MRLYHGSDVAVIRPQIAYNEGFADLGRGFYLTDDEAVARQRARSRARRTGGTPTVSVFELDADALPWASWGASGPALAGDAGVSLFALRFDETPAGLAAWAGYIQACRMGRTEAGALGSPVLVRAWIATEEIEMVCSGFIAPEELAEVLDPAALVVQYCLTSQPVLDEHLHFVEALT